tara:strand:- start:321 stop:632 length:312 start_codon:yes stop_codon:yes gene_type:complete
VPRQRRSSTIENQTSWERIAPINTVHGQALQGVAQGFRIFACSRGAPNGTKRSSYFFLIMRTFLNWLAVYTAAGAFGVAVVQTAMTEPFQGHSGTQTYVRVTR